MPNLIIFSLEPHDGRYTQQWHQNIPRLFQNQLPPNWQVIQIDGEQSHAEVTPGAFLNFAHTNYWKSTQMCEFLRLHARGVITDTDRFLFTDFWNPVITQVAYMRDLLRTHWQLHAIAHAGAYDPTDILGLNMQKPWPWHAERGWFYACDRTYFATEFHRNMFLRNLYIPTQDHHRAVRSGQPHELVIPELLAHRSADRKPWVIWPHRVNSDKQPEIARDLAQRLSLELVITQDQNLSKADYYQLLGQSQITLSTSLHENLGISQMEGCLTGSLPCVPDRASYTEMYFPEFRYPSAWTASWSQYLDHRDQLVAFIENLAANYNQLQPRLDQQNQRLRSDYLTADIMRSVILDSAC